MKREKAHSYDLDDTLISREGSTRLAGLITGHLASHHLPDLTREQLPDISRAIVDTPLSFFESQALRFHAHRQVLPGVAESLARVASGGIDIYGNTGRPNKRPWVETTKQTLAEGGIFPSFKQIFHTPEGIKTAVSKAVGIRDLLQQYDKVAHFEDDPRTAVFIAKLFPEVQVYLIQYSLTGLLYSRTEIEAFPNIQRIAHIGEAP